MQSGRFDFGVEWRCVAPKAFYPEKLNLDKLLKPNPDLQKLFEAQRK